MLKICPGEGGTKGAAEDFMDFWDDSDGYGLTRSANTALHRSIHSYRTVAIGGLSAHLRSLIHKVEPELRIPLIRVPTKTYLRTLTKRNH